MREDIYPCHGNWRGRNLMKLEFNVAVTGIPGTGKTTLCKQLSASGYDVIDLNEMSEKYGCTQKSQVSIECLDHHIQSIKGYILDGHYAHLLSVYGVIIMECSPDVLEGRLRSRGYDSTKIRENMDCLLSDTPWFESRDLYPESKILRIRSDNGGTLNKAEEFIRRLEIKYNGFR